MSAKNLNNDLNRINNSAFQWKISFNPDLNKPNKFFFLAKFKNHLNFLWFLIIIYSIVLIIIQSLTQKHLRMLLDTTLDFQEHLKSIFSKVNKTIGFLQELHHILLSSPLLTIYKSFIRLRLNSGDIIYDQVYNASFHQKLDSI